MSEIVGEILCKTLSQSVSVTTTGLLGVQTLWLARPPGIQTLQSHNKAGAETLYCIKKNDATSWKLLQ